MNQAQSRHIVKPFLPRKKIKPVKGLWKPIPKRFLNPKRVKTVPDNWREKK